MDAEQIAALEDMLTRVVQAEFQSLDTKLEVLARITRDGFTAISARLDGIEGRLAALELRASAIEGRLDRLVSDVTRGRTSDIERIAGLERRVAELEARLAKPSH